MKILSNHNDSSELDDLIFICKSDSGVKGVRLREAHRRLGEYVSRMISSDYGLREYTVISLMRAGLSFGEGIANGLDCTMLLLDDKNDRRWISDRGYEFIREYEDKLRNRVVIIADAVINSGQTINAVYDIISTVTDSIIVASNVVQNDFFDQCKEVYCVRVSENKFKGGKVNEQKNGFGPDTGDRLFRTF